MNAVSASGNVRRALVAAALAVLAFGLSSPAQAHAFGARYELPVPVWLFVVGGAVTVTLTFLLVGLFVRTGPERYANARWALPGTIRCVLRHPWTLGIAKSVAVALLALVLFHAVRLRTQVTPSSSTRQTCSDPNLAMVSVTKAGGSSLAYFMAAALVGPMKISQFQCLPISFTL